MRAAWHNWNAAMAVANGYAALKGVRHRVYRNADGHWSIAEVGVPLVVLSNG